MATLARHSASAVRSYLGVLPALCSLLDAPDAELLLAVCEALEATLAAGEANSTAGVNRCVELIDEAGGIDKLEALQLHENAEVYTKVRGARPDAQMAPCDAPHTLRRAYCMQPTASSPAHAAHRIEPTAWSPAHAAHRTEPSACSPPHGAQRMQPTASSPAHAAHRIEPTGGMGGAAWRARSLGEIGSSFALHWRRRCSRVDRRWACWTATLDQRRARRTRRSHPRRTRTDLPLGCQESHERTPPRCVPLLLPRTTPPRPTLPPTTPPRTMPPPTRRDSGDTDSLRPSLRHLSIWVQGLLLPATLLLVVSPTMCGSRLPGC